MSYKKKKESLYKKTGVNRASKYIKIYNEEFKNGQDYFKARVLDGWKRLYKIRMITMSNLDYH